MAEQSRIDRMVAEARSRERTQAGVSAVVLALVVLAAGFTAGAMRCTSFTAPNESAHHG